MVRPSNVEILTSDVQSEEYTRTSCRQTETHDDKDGGIRRDTHQHPKHHRQGQRGQQSLGPAQPEEKQTRVLNQPDRHQFTSDFLEEQLQLIDR